MFKFNFRTINRLKMHIYQCSVQYISDTRASTLPVGFTGHCSPLGGHQRIFVYSTVYYLLYVTYIIMISKNSQYHPADLLLMEGGGHMDPGLMLPYLLTNLISWGFNWVQTKLLAAGSSWLAPCIKINQMGEPPCNRPSPY